MRIAIFSRTPLAAAPWELYKALKKYTYHKVWLINQFVRYSDGRFFPYHLLMHSNNGQAVQILRSADLWHVHNYLPRQLPPYVMERNGRRKKVMAQFHSLPRLGNWEALMRFADISYTIRQPLHEKEYGLPGLPNIIDPDEYYPIRRPKTVRIAFAPTTRTEPGHLDSKGYYQVKRILDQVAREKPVEIVWIEGKGYEENLKLKQGCHILIDDVVTGNWHRTSLEGACFGCAVMNRANKMPFVFANLQNLREKLHWLIDSEATLRDYQERTRLWVLQEWHAMDKIKDYQRAYRKLAGN